jgi:polyisoprenoid-binding protein YceI
MRHVLPEATSSASIDAPAALAVKLLEQPMRHVAFLLFAVLLSALPASAAEQWRLIPEKSTLQVVFKQGGKEVTGRFRRFDGTIAFSPDDLQHSEVTINIDLSSFESGDGSRDSQARGPAWLDAASIPQATYKIIAFRPLTRGVYMVDADLTLRGVTKRLTHSVAIRTERGLGAANGRVPVSRIAFGVGRQPDPSGKTVGLEIDVRFAIQAEREPS